MDIAIIIALTTALTQMVKTSFVVESKYAPILSIIVGVSLTFLYGGVEWQPLLINGIIAGLSASGLYSGTKAINK